MRDCQSKNILILQLSSFQQENVCVALFLAMSVLTFNDLLANVFFSQNDRACIILHVLHEMSRHYVHQ